MLSIFVVWVRYEILDTDTYVSTMSSLAANSEVQQALATKVSDAVTAKAHVSQAVHDALPPKAQFLVTPASDALKTLLHKTTLQIVQSQAFQKTWATLNRKAHQQVVILLTGQQGHAVTSTANGEVVLNLEPVVKQVEHRLDAHGVTVFDKALNDVQGPEFVLFESKQLAQIQGLVRFLNHLAIALPIVGLMLLAASVLLAPGRRRGLLRVGLALGVTMGLVSLVLDVVRHLVVTGRAAVPPGVRGAVFDVVLAIPASVTRGVLVASLLLAAGAAVLGSRQLRWVVEDGPVRRFFLRWWLAVEAVVVVVAVLTVAFWNSPGPGALIVIGAVTAAVVLVVAALGSPGLDRLKGAGQGGDRELRERRRGAKPSGVSGSGAARR